MAAGKKKPIKAIHVVVGTPDDDCPICRAAKEGPEAFIKAVAKQDPDAARGMEKGGLYQDGKPIVLSWPERSRERG